MSAVLEDIREKPAADQATLAIRIIVFFAIHPEEELTTEDVSVKFDYPSRKVWPCLTRSVQRGLLEFEEIKSGRMAYSAGPLLKRMIGKTREVSDSTMAAIIAACAPIHVEPNWSR